MPAETDCMKDISLNPKRESFGWDWLCGFSGWIMELFIMRSIVSFSSPKKEEHCRGVDQNRTFPKPPVVAASHFLSLLLLSPIGCSRDVCVSQTPLRMSWGLMDMQRWLILIHVGLAVTCLYIVVSVCLSLALLWAEQNQDNEIIKWQQNRRKQRMAIVSVFAWSLLCTGELL